MNRPYEDLRVNGGTDREGGRTSITRGGCEAAPHLNLLPLGEEAGGEGAHKGAPTGVRGV